MKKYISISLFLLISLVSIYALNEIYNSKLKMDKITQINIYQAGTLKDSYTPISTDDLAYDLDYIALLDMLNNMVEADNSDNGYEKKNDYKVDIITNDKTLSYDISFDLDNLVIYISFDEKLYMAKEDLLEEIFNSKLFDHIYYADFLASHRISINNNEIISSVRADLDYNTAYNSKRTKNLSYSTGIDTVIIEDFDLSNLVTMDFQGSPSSIFIQAFEGEDMILEKKVEANTFKLLKRQGLTAYKIKTLWSDESGKDIRGEIDYDFSVDIDLKPEFKIISNNKGAGEFFMIKALYLDEDEKPLVKSDDIRNKDFDKIGDDYLLIIPLNYYQKKANYNLDFYVVKDHIESHVESKKLIIENRKFTSQNLIIDKSTVAATSTDYAYTEFAKYFTPAREKSHPKAYFNEGFMLPIDGRISTEFGMMRYVNGSLTSYRHSGIDIAVPKGTPIPATNKGRVVLSMELILTGNTIVIDHGLGIFSVYYHMDSLDADADDMVDKGEIIGTVGSTGRSTGPHLHFTTSFYKTNINPYFLFNLSDDEIYNLIN